VILAMRVTGIEHLEGDPMRTISIQADGEHLDRMMEEWLAHLVLAVPVGPHGIKFDGDLSDGTIVNHRAQGRWTVSLRPSPGGSRSRTYSNPYAVARVIIAREHETPGNLPARDDPSSERKALAMVPRYNVTVRAQDFQSGNDSRNPRSAPGCLSLSAAAGRRTTQPGPDVPAETPDAMAWSVPAETRGTSALVLAHDSRRLPSPAGCGP
jgi:hypothetical protein